MPLPLLIWAAVAAAGAIGGAIALASSDEDEDEDEDDEVGLDIAILGPTATGKTTLARFIAYGLEKTKEQSNIPEKMEADRLLELRGVKQKIGTVIDVPGSKGRYPTWKRAIGEADIVLYLIRIDELMKNDKNHTSRIREDVGQIGKWLEDNKKDYSYSFIIGTHCDQIDKKFAELALNNLLSNEIRELEDQVMQKDIYSYIKKHFLRSGSEIILLCGSLKETKNIKNVIYRMLKWIHSDLI